jgi:hypothetical protein
MSKLKAFVALVVAALSYLSHLSLPAPYGDIVAAALAGAAYLTTHEDLLRGIGKALGLGALVLLVGCAGLPPLPTTVPSLEALDAIGLTVQQAARWAQDHGASATNLEAVRAAFERRDPAAAVTVLRETFATIARNGYSVPPEMVALLDTAEGALAAQAVEAGMRALSRP